LGEVRTYAYTGRDFSADAWFSAVKQGHTFVTNGPMVQLTVNGRMPGDTVTVARNATARVKVRAWAPEEIGSPKTLEVIGHGKVIRTVTSAGPAKSELKAEFDIRLDSSQWIVARVSSHNGGYAHTSPVYVSVDGEPFFDRTQLPDLVKKRLGVLEYIESRLRDPKYAATYRPGEIDALRERLASARAEYQRLGR
jgi:hypothetical protein